MKTCSWKSTLCYSCDVTISKNKDCEMTHSGLYFFFIVCRGNNIPVEYKKNSWQKIGPRDRASRKKSKTKVGALLNIKQVFLVFYEICQVFRTLNNGGFFTGLFHSSKNVFTYFLTSERALDLKCRIICLGVTISGQPKITLGFIIWFSSSRHFQRMLLIKTETQYRVNYCNFGVS